MQCYLNWCSKKKIDHDKEEENEMGWKLSDEGLKKLGEITSGKQFNHVLTYTQFMEKVESIMNQCFRKKRIFKKKNDEMTKDFVGIYKEIVKFATKGKIERKVANQYREIVRNENLKVVSKRKAIKVKKILTTLTDEDKCSTLGWWKMCNSMFRNKFICSSIINEKGMEVYGSQMIKNEYKREFEHRLRTREIDKKNDPV